MSLFYHDSALLESIFRNFNAYAKEILDGRLREPIEILLLPQMGLLGSKTSTEKKIVRELPQITLAFRGG